MTWCFSYPHCPELKTVKKLPITCTKLCRTEPTYAALLIYFNSDTLHCIEWLRIVKYSQKQECNWKQKMSNIL